MDRLSVDLLGGFALRKPDGSSIELPTKKAQALIAYLSLNHSQLHTREKLASLLWGEFAAEQSRQSLRQTLFAIRRAFGEGIPNPVSAEGDTVSFDPSLVTVDAIEFETLVRQATSESLTAAIALWKGELLDGVNVGDANFDEWAASQRERFHEVAISANSRLLAQQQADEQDEKVVLTCRRLLALDPLQERIHRVLMQTYMKQRRYAAAIKQYHTCATLVRRQLGIAPEAETTRLHDELLRVRAGTHRDEKSKAKRILVVEDNALNARLIQAYLAGSSYEVTVAVDGAQALLEIGSNKPDLVLLDINLPIVDGLTLLDVLRRNDLRVPTILMTAMPGEQTEVEGLDLGAADFLRKPVQKAVLLKRIEKALREAKATGQAHAV